MMAAGTQNRVRGLKAFFADKRGSAILEAGLAAPILAALVAGVSDVSMGFSAKLKVQQAATRSIELATAGGLNSAAFDTLRADAAQAAGVPESQVTVDKWLECSGTRQASFNDVCVSGQTVARYVSVSVIYAFKPSFSFLLHTANMTQDGTIPITGYAAVRVQ